MVRLVPATAADRRRIMRVRPPPEAARFVHYNWFWLDRSVADPAIRFCRVRAGPRGGVAAVVAFGPHEVMDGDPSSRLPNFGEIYHLVVDRNRARQGIGRAAVLAAAARMATDAPELTAIRIAHNPGNLAAAALFASLGFRPIGEKVDAEDGTRDVLREADLAALSALHESVAVER